MFFLPPALRRAADIFCRRYYAATLLFCFALRAIRAIAADKTD